MLSGMAAFLLRDRGLSTLTMAAMRGKTFMDALLSFHGARDIIDRNSRFETSLGLKCHKSVNSVVFALRLRYGYGVDARDVCDALGLSPRPRASTARSGLRCRIEAPVSGQMIAPNRI